jgi:dipeptidyl aminopeptidase/acylaminoacyl peptidase
MDMTNIRSFAFVGDSLLGSPVKSIVVDFPGLGSTEMKKELDTFESELAGKGALFLSPFVNPWNWMNEKTVDFVDYLCDILKRKFSPNCKVVTKGYSMGGHSSLTYPMFSKHAVSAALAVCPVCDIHFHYSERPDLPRTFHDAYGSYDDISEVLKSRSPIYHIDKMQNCKYLIIHGCLDQAVSKKKHSDRLVPLMRTQGKTVAYIEDADMKHCSPMAESTTESMLRFLRDECV